MVYMELSIHNGYLKVVVVSGEIGCDPVFIQHWHESLYKTAGGAMLCYTPHGVVSGHQQIVSTEC